MKKVIGLIDCDCFFASCEQKINPALKNKPVCVVTGGKNGCVVARSREAKIMGVPMGEPYFKAIQNFPQALYVPARHDVYEAESEKVMNLIKTFSPLVEVVSIDEAYIDLTGTEKLFQKPYPLIALHMRNKIKELTDINVSIGLSSSKTLAKLASDKAKNTGGLFVINQSDIRRVLETTAIDDVAGIGRNYQKLLHYHAVYQASDLIKKTDSWLKQYMGIKGVELKYELLGQSISAVDAHYKAPQSIQRSRALGLFTSDKNILKSALCQRIHEACREAREHKAFTKEIELFLRTKDFRRFCDKTTLPAPTNSEREIIPAALKLLEKIYRLNVLYRSIGIGFENLTYHDNCQLSLFEEKPSDQLGFVIDTLEKKFGKNIIKTGFF